MAATLGPAERDAILERFDETARSSALNVVTRRLLERLAEIESKQHPILSVYLDLSPAARLKRAWATTLKSLAKEHAAGANGDAGDLAAEIQLVEDSIADALPELGRGVAHFVSASLGLSTRVALPLPLPNRLRVAPRPFLRPLARVLDEHERFGVVLLDKRHARLFIHQLGDLVEVADLFEDTPARHKQGGWSQIRFQRHHEAHVLWHAGAVAHATELMMQRFEARHLLVAGSPDVLREYKEHLPVHAADSIAGLFQAPIDASRDAIVDQAEPLVREVEAAEEMRTIDGIESSISSGKGVWGAHDVAHALVAGRVRTLVVDDEYRGDQDDALAEALAAEGYFGEANGTDLGELMLERALRQQAEIEIVRSENARERLRQRAPVGALLRF